MAVALIALLVVAVLPACLAAPAHDAADAPVEDPDAAAQDKTSPKGWLKLPKNVPKSMRSQIQLDDFTSKHEFISPLLGGEFGDVMYQLAAAHTLARQHARTCLVAWWEQLDDAFLDAHPFFKQFPDPAPNITLKNIFPNIRFVNFLPATKHILGSDQCFCMDLSSSEFTPFPNEVATGHIKFISGRFHHPKYFHTNREHLLSHVFNFHTAMIHFLLDKYRHVNEEGHPLVSVHIAKDSEHAPSRAWYRHVIEDVLDPERMHFLVFSEDPAALALFDDVKTRHPDLQYTHVEENPALSLLLMSVCTHHVVSMSTLGFWGAYLDRKQPQGGRVIVAPGYETRFKVPLPFRDWEVPAEPSAAGEIKSIEEKFMLDWHKIPPNSPWVLSTEKELATFLETSQFISPVLSGGLGNTMFQLAAAHVLAKELNVPCLVAWWDQKEKHLPRHFRKFDGYGDPAPGISLKHIFPSFHFVDFNPKTRQIRNSTQCFRLGMPGGYVKFSDEVKHLQKPFIQGLFFQNEYFHHERAYLLDTVFAFHPAMTAYLSLKYSSVLRGERVPVSVHFRVSSRRNEPASFNNRRFPTNEWYRHVIEDLLDPEHMHFLVFSEDTTALALFDDIKTRHPDLKFTYIEENPALSMHLMSLCTHHVVTVSTFGFWGAYLDRKQPQGGRVIVAPGYEMTHGARLPFREWEVPAEPSVGEHEGEAVQE